MFAINSIGSSYIARPLNPLGLKDDEDVCAFEKRATQIGKIAVIFFAILSVVGIPFAIWAIHQAYSSSEFSSSGLYEVGEEEGPPIVVINGIKTSSEVAVSKAQQLIRNSTGKDNLKITVVHNAQNANGFQPVSIFMDIFEAMFGLCTYPVQLLMEQWNKILEKLDLKKKVLQVCHSRGAGLVKEALLKSVKEVRDRIIVIALAPAAVIPRKLCHRVVNLKSKNDIVTELNDPIGIFKYKKDLITLKSQSKGLDHGVLSPTLREPVKLAISQFIETGDIEGIAEIIKSNV